MWKSMKAAWDYYRHPDMPNGPRIDRSVHDTDDTVDFYSGETYQYTYLPDGRTVTDGPHIDISKKGLWVNGKEWI